jgi:hypothetical protein
MIQVQQVQASTSKCGAMKLLDKIILAKFKMAILKNKGEKEKERKRTPSVLPRKKSLNAHSRTADGKLQRKRRKQ